MSDTLSPPEKASAWLVVGTIGWLVLCVLLGGASAGGLLANLLLQFMAACVTSVFIWRARRLPLVRGEAALHWIVGVICAWVVLTLIPLPPALWSALPGRTPIVSGYRLLDLSLPWLSVSLDDARTVRSALSLLVPVTTYLLVRRLDQAARIWLLIGVLAVASLSFVLGVAQQIGGSGSSLRFYAITNPDSPVGLFANVNHHATLLVVIVPLGAAWMNGWSRSSGRARLLAGFAFALLVGAVTLGLVLAKSLAGLGLLVPAVLGGLAILIDYPGDRSRRIIPAIACVAIALTLTCFLVLGNASIAGKFADVPTSRAVATPITLKAARDHMPVGSGLGTFAPVFAANQPDETVSASWMNHAHNDVAELVLELGLVGALAIASFAVWLGRITWAAWMSSVADRSPVARAATLALLLISLHSFVDYPLRTAAIASLFGALLALALAPNRRGRGFTETEVATAL